MGQTRRQKAKANRRKREEALYRREEDRWKKRQNLTGDLERFSGLAWSHAPMGDGSPSPRRRW